MSWVIETCFDFLSKVIGCLGHGDFSKEGLVMEYICCEDFENGHVLVDIGTGLLVVCLVPWVGC